MHAPHVAGHLGGEAGFGRQDEQPQIRILAEQPGAEQADQGRLAGVAEHHQQQAAVACRPTLVQPRRPSADGGPGVSRPCCMFQADHEWLKSTGQRAGALRQALRPGAGGASARRPARSGRRLARRRSIEQAPDSSGRRPSETERPAKSSRLRRRRPSKLLPHVVDAQAGLARPRGVELPALLDQTLEDGVGRAAGGADPGTAGPGALLGQPAAQATTPAADAPRCRAGASPGSADRDPGSAPCPGPAAPAGSSARLRPRVARLFESAHHVFPMISEVTDRIVQKAGVVLRDQPGRLAQPAAPARGAYGGVASEQTGARGRGSDAQPVAGVGAQAPVASRRNTIRTGR